MPDECEFIKEHCPHCSKPTQHWFDENRGWVCVSCNRTGSECFISTSICRTLNLADECYQLQVLRNFRDTHLRQSKKGKLLIKDYYRIAPNIVRKIEQLPNKEVFYRNLYETYLSKTITLIEKGRKREAIECYIGMVEFIQHEVS